MKKQLLASTALAAVGALALSSAAVAQDKKMMKPSLSVGGAWEANVGVADNDVDGQDGVGVQQDVEVHFKGKAPLDNGITISTTVELEGNTGGDTIDETKVFISGDFGQIQIGALDEASYEMTFGYHGSTGLRNTGNQTLEFDIGSWVPASKDSNDPSKNLGALGASSGRVALANDPDTVAYYTPRFNGFQMGVSYSRSDGQDSPPLHNTDTKEMKDIVAAAVNYDETHGDTRVGAAFGYITANVEGNYTAKDGTRKEVDDPQNWGGGLWVGFSGVTVGVGYVRHNEIKEDDELDRWDVGARYTWGPNAVSLGYIHLEQEKRETAAGKLSYSRSLGPGVWWSLDVLWAEYENDNSTLKRPDSTPITSQDGTAYTTGIKVAF